MSLYCHSITKMTTRSRQIQKLLRVGIQTACLEGSKTSGINRRLTHPAFRQARMYSTQVQEAILDVNSQSYAMEASMNTKKKWLMVKWLDGTRSDYPYVWLRDNCQCSKCFHPTSLARLYLMQDLDINVQPRHVETTDSGDIHMVWPDGHESLFNGYWLKEHSFTPEKRAKRSQIYEWNQKLWGNREIEEKMPRENYEKIMQSDEALYEWLSGFQKYGLGIVNNMDGRGGMLRFCNRISFHKTTHYGEMFEVETKEDPSNLTYTAASLGLHTDLTYYDYQPGIQLLNCVQQAEGIGGDNGFVDAFNAGYILKETRPDLYTILTTVPLDNWDIGSDFRNYFKVFRSPVIRLDKNDKIWQIRYNNQVRDSFMDMSANMVGPMYEALKEYNNTLYDPELTTKIKLKSGEMVVFDNWRVLHSRFGFTGDGPVRRYLEGGFMDWDEVYSTLRLLKRKLKKP